MFAPTSPNLRLLLAAVRTLLVLTVILGVVYPLAMTGLAQVALTSDANGSLVFRDGHTVGSALIGQAFTRPVLEGGVPKRDVDGSVVLEPDPTYFQTRPSAAGIGYDPRSSGASNLGPENPKLVASIRKRRAEVAALDGVAVGAVPGEALLASGSGLDPHISPAYAAQQVQRVARARGLDPEAVQAAVDAATQGRQFGFLGEPVVNVLELNLELDAMSQ